MREFKFRAWDGKFMRYDFVVAGSQYCNALSILQDEEFARSTYKVYEWKVMQFTGLLDKNKREIYESDVVKDLDGCISPVKWFNTFDGYDWNGFHCDFELWSGVEVIGNIYENPELLT